MTREVPDALTPAHENRLLASLPQAEWAMLQPHLERVELTARQVLYEPYDPIDAVYFPLTGVVSLLALDDAGQAVEVAATGNEGLVGIPVFLGAPRSPLRGVCQIPGRVERLEAGLFVALIDRLPALRALLQRYTQTLLFQMAQAALCNRLHHIDQRCARWLLMAHDRVTLDSFPLTHEFLSGMLGVRRATVTVAVRRLADEGLIDYRWGQMTVADRSGLERAACSCYRRISEEYAQLLGLNAAQCPAV